MTLDPNRSSPIADPVRPSLEYAMPVGRSRALRLTIGIIASAFFAFGFGMIAAGLMMGWHNEREAAPFLAVGVGCVVFGVGVIGTAWYARR